MLKHMKISDPGCDQPGSWERPIPLQGVGKAEPFPLDAFPIKLCNFCNYIQSISDSVQVPVDLPAMLALTIFGAALAKKVRVLGVNGHTEPVNLYVMVAMEPGTRKSAVMAELIRPIDEYERSENRRIRAENAKLEIRRKELEREAKNPSGAQEPIQASTDDTADGCSGQAKAIEAEQTLLHPKPLVKLYTDDVTEEKLQRLLAEHGGRMAIFSAEGNLVDMILGKYKKRPDIGVYLKGHAGDTIKVDRAGSESFSGDVYSPALSIGITAQPYVVDKLRNTDGMQARGLIGRFLFVLPESSLGRRTFRAPEISEGYRDAYHALVSRLLKFGQGCVDSTEEHHSTLKFNSDAERVIEVFFNRVETGLAEGGEFEAMGDWAGKCVGAVCRIAGILHCLQPTESDGVSTATVSKETAACAVRIGEYLLSHAKVVYGVNATGPALRLAHRIAAKLKGYGDETISRRSVHKMVGSNRPGTDLNEPLRLLEVHGFIVPSPCKYTGRGRPPGQTYEINPHVRGIVALGKHTSQLKVAADTGQGAGCTPTEGAVGANDRHESDSNNMEEAA